MVELSLVNWGMVLFLFVALPVAMMRYMVHRTIEVDDEHH